MGTGWFCQPSRGATSEIRTFFGSDMIFTSSVHDARGLEGGQLLVAEVVAIIDKAGIPAAPIYDCEALCKDDSIIKDREMLVTVPSPKNHKEVAALTVIGNPIKMSETPVKYKKAAPDLGEDNDEIFRELGFSDEQLAAFKAAGVMN